MTDSDISIPVTPTPPPSETAEFPCDNCGTETGSDVMSFCSQRCQVDWTIRRGKELRGDA